MPEDLCDACLVARRDDAPVAFIVRVITEAATATQPEVFNVDREVRIIRLCRRCYVNREWMAEDGDDPLA